MTFRIRSRLYYQHSGPASILCSLRPLVSAGQQVLADSLCSIPEQSSLDLEVGSPANRMTRFDVEDTGELCLSYEGIVETAPDTLPRPTGRKPVAYPGDPGAIPFLFPSRYVPSDCFTRAAHELFGSIGNPFDQATAIEQWLFDHISYVYGSSDENTSAGETFLQRKGVCRDFAHLGIAFCRALFLPARYVTLYSHLLEPQDFHAAFEVLLDGEWHLFDGTRLAPLNALIRIAIGRDAAETAVASLSGSISATGMEIHVHREENGEEFIPLSRHDLARSDRSLVLR